PWTVFAFLLPFIEQKAIYAAQTKGNCPPGGYCGGQYFQAVPTYLCPADSTTTAGLSQTTNGGANGFAVSNYSANYYVFGNPNASGGDYYCVQGSAKIPSSVPDGLSNTIFFREIYGSCSLSPDPAHGASPPSPWPD